MDRKTTQQSSQQISRMKGKEGVAAKEKRLKLAAWHDLAGHKQKQTYPQQLCPQPAPRARVQLPLWVLGGSSWGSSR